MPSPPAPQNAASRNLLKYLLQGWRLLNIPKRKLQAFIYPVSIHNALNAEVHVELEPALRLCRRRSCTPRYLDAPRRRKKGKPRKAGESGLLVQTYRDFFTGIISPVGKVL
jgi:hypothetical protein